MNIITINNLTKIFNPNSKSSRVTALNNFSLTVNESTIFGLLGPNGAGKTTLIKILLGIVFPTSGTAEILNKKIDDYLVRKHVGYLPENHKFPLYLTGEDVLKYYAQLSGCSKEGLQEKIDSLLKLVKMYKWKRTKVKSYSKGMMQRLGLAHALIADPKIIFLDEPTDGVDPLGRKEIRDILLELKSEGKTIFLNSHLLSEVELVCDRVAILHKGSLVREGTVVDITTQKEIYEIKINQKLDSEIVRKSTEGFSFSQKDDYTLHLKVESPEQRDKLLDKFRQNGISIEAMLPLKTSLEDMFINLIHETDNREDNE
ncbi:MAG: ABC transporter ATP-binding protein [Melioribacteraceae bacterium]|nr:ABC transporter ATP-binding protein [Melioribacteraceae bacterium]MDD3558103.1 ABC transporter ATP-binding protein [Melioribacteraceae bacterium]